MIYFFIQAELFNVHDRLRDIISPVLGILIITNVKHTWYLVDSFIHND